MFLCIDLQPDSTLLATEVNTQGDCIGYIAQIADPTITGLSISDANSLLGATAVLFVTAFIIRSVLRFISNR